MADVIESKLTLQHDTNVTRVTDAIVSSPVSKGGATRYTNSSGAPAAVAKRVVFKVTVGGGGTASIDWTNLTDLDGNTVTFNGIKLVHWYAEAGSANVNPLTLKKGATNGFAPAGAGFEITLPYGGTGDGQNLAGRGNAVGGSAKVWDVTGTAGETVVVSASAA